MEDEEIITRLTGIFREIFENDAIELTPETKSQDIKGWDSMANVTIAVEIEQRFKIRIKPAEMEALKDIRDLAGLIRQHLAPAAT